MKRFPYLNWFYLLFVTASLPLTAQKFPVQVSSPREFFIENKGQWPAEVRYLTRIGGMDAWITRNGITYDLYAFKKSADEPTHLLHDEPFKNNTRKTGHVVAMRFKNALANTETEARDEQHGFYNYFIGNDASKWARNVKLFKEVSLLNVYEGIDARIYFDNGSLRYDMILNAGADPEQIAMSFDGADAISINNNGELVLKTSLGDLIQQKLFAYQERDGVKQKVECRFVLENGEVRFDVGRYDRSLALVIDPLVYSTYIGGSRDEHISAITVDESGYVYIAGATISSGYPTTANAYDSEFTVNNMGNPNAFWYDAIVSKLSRDGSELEYSTFIGSGSSGENAAAIAVDKSFNVYITGYVGRIAGTINDTFPTTQGVFGMTESSSSEAFVAKLNTINGGLIYSTFLGGTHNEEGTGIVVDRNGNVYVTGNTNSEDFPVSPNAFDNNLGNGSITSANHDLFITKINLDASAILYSTYLGDTAPNSSEFRFLSDFSGGIAIDSTGNIYVAGTTTSEHFPVTAGAFDTKIGTGRLEGQLFIKQEDVFVSKFNSTLSTLLYSTFIGGDSSDVVGDRYGVNGVNNS